MENFLICLNAVLPMFVIMAVGYVAKLAGLLTEEQVPKINKISFRVFMPCLIFYNLYTSDLSSAVRPKLILFAVLGVLTAYAVTAVIVLLTVPQPERRGVMIQGIFRSNYVVIGLPIASSLLNGQGLGTVAILVAVVVPIFNVLAVVTLSVFTGKRTSAAEVVKSIVTNPLILGTLAGVLTLLCGIRLPLFLDEAVRELGAAATPLQIFLLGAFFHFDGLAKYRVNLTWVVLGRLVIIPGVLLGLGALLGFRGAEFVALIGCFAAPTAIASFTMTEQMGGDAELAGDIVVMTNAVCTVTIFAWSLLFKTMGLF